MARRGSCKIPASASAVAAAEYRLLSADGIKTIEKMAEKQR